MKYYLVPVRMSVIKTTNNAGGDAEKRDHSYTVGGNLNWYNHCRKQYKGFSKS